MVEQFLKQSEVGQVSTGLQIKAALETVVGHQVAKTTVYRVLRHHQRRKVVPRPRHPQASAAPSKRRLKKLPPAGRGSPPRARPAGHAPGYDHGPG